MSDRETGKTNRVPNEPTKTTVRMRANRRMFQRLRLVALSAVGSLKIKIELVLCCCVVFTLVALASRVPDFLGWTENQSLSSMPPVAESRRGYAIVMNTWKRHDLLKQSVSHYTMCRGLDSVHVVWSEPEAPPDSLKRFLSRVVRSNARDGRQVEVKFDINREDSLNNRFKEIRGLKTDAVFSIDDDVIFPCSSVEFAFSVWQSAPNTMVGFVPRIHSVDPSRGNRYIYGGWWSVWWSGSYSMVLSKASFFHKKYLSMYTNEMPASIREYTTRNRNCEDIAMSFLIANASGAPPVWVKGKIFEIGSTGISSLGGHNEKRSECINRFIVEFGRMPLVTTSVKAVDSRNIWFW